MACEHMWRPFCRHLARQTRATTTARNTVWQQTSSYATTPLYSHTPKGKVQLIGRFTHRRHSRHVRDYATVVSDTPSVMVNDLRHQEVLVNFSENHTVRYPSFWLRDHCQCSECTHPHSKQRQIDTFSLDPDIQATAVTPTASGLRITWSQSHHESLFPWSWLSSHTPFSAQPTAKHPRQTWTHVPPSRATDIQTDYDAITTTTAGLSSFLNQIRTYGFSFISNTPATPSATQSLLERISFIRPTQYGAFWDFTSQPRPIDTAYTNLALPLHTDTTYFTDPAGLQLFHVLTPAPHGGGASTFADAFAAATHLHTTSPDAYNILSSTRIASHASGSSSSHFTNTAAHAAGFPVFTHSTPHTRPHPRDLTQIRWNNDDRASSTQWPSHERMVAWYAAARQWSQILASREFCWEVQLRPGMPVIFDNWRIVHGRRAFEAERRVCGGYIGMDEFLARCAGVKGEVEMRPDEGEKERERENEEQVKREQVEEERIQREEEGTGKDGEGSIEPDVVPQSEEGVDRPVAS